MAFHT